MSTIGPLTPTKIASLALLVAGLAVLLLGRALTDYDPSAVNGLGLALLGLSFLVDALLPGGSELSPEQAAALAHNRIPNSPGFVRTVSAAIGAALVAAGLLLLTLRR